MSQVDDVKHFIQDCLKNQVKTLNWLEAHGPDIIRHSVPMFIGMVPVPPFMRNRMADFYIVRLLDYIAYARKVNAVQQAMVLYVGSPDALRAAAAALGVAVTSKAEDFATANVREASLLAMSDPSQWTGPGSSEYAKYFDGQAAAWARISEYSGGMEDALNQSAKNIEDYYNGLRDAVIGLLEFIVGLVALILGWPTIIVGIAGAVVAILGVVNIVNGLTDLSNDQMLSTKESLDKLNENIQPWPTAAFATP